MQRMSHRIMDRLHHLGIRFVVRVRLSNCLDGYLELHACHLALVRILIRGGPSLGSLRGEGEEVSE